jgi:hypothetical protein
MTKASPNAIKGSVFAKNAGHCPRMALNWRAISQSRGGERVIGESNITKYFLRRMSLGSG